MPRATGTTITGPRRGTQQGGQGGQGGQLFSRVRQPLALPGAFIMRPHWIERYRRHFLTHFGQPFDSRPYQQRKRPPSRSSPTTSIYPKFRVFASLGLVNYALDVKEVAEVIQVTDAGWKEVPLLFVNALFFAVQQRIPLDPRYSPSVWPHWPRRSQSAAEQERPVHHAGGRLRRGLRAGGPRRRHGRSTGAVHHAGGAGVSGAPRRPGMEEKLRTQDADLCGLRRPSCV